MVIPGVNVNQPVGISGDNASILVQLPFTVLYYGVNYTSLWVYSNGFISFTSGNYAGTSPRSLPNNNMRDAIVAPFWRVLKLSQGGSIKTGHIIDSWPGDNGLGSYQVFTWDSIPDQNGHLQTFQLLLEDRPDWSYDLQNKIYFQYLSITNDMPTTIGVQDRLGHHGESYQLSQISNQTAGGMIDYGHGYRLSGLEYTVTKSDSNAELTPDGNLEDGWNVDLNSTGTHTPPSFWSTVIEIGAQTLLDAIGAGEVVDGLFVLYDLTSAAASDAYVPASGTLVAAGPGANQASGIVCCDSQGAPYDGSFAGGYPFDASFTDGVYWYMLDAGSQNHTITVTATAIYLDSNYNGYSVSTAVVLNMYTGYHYVDIRSSLQGTPPQETSGVNIWIAGQRYSTPVSSLIVPDGAYPITADTPI